MSFRRRVLLLSLFCLGRSISAWENGFLLANDFQFTSLAGGDEKTYDIAESLKLSLWLSFKPVDNAALYIKSSFDCENTGIFKTADAWKLAGELDILRFTVSAPPLFYAELGRVPFQDSLGLVANAAFDGATLGFAGERHAFSASAFYTGLTYKQTARLLLSQRDKFAYYEGGYFAPPHLIMSAAYDFFPPFWEDSQLSVNLIHEIDLRENARSRTTFALCKIALPFAENYLLQGGAAFAWAEENEVPQYSIASTIDFSIDLSRFYPSQLLFEIKLLYGAFDAAQPMPVITFRDLSALYSPEQARLITFKTSYLARFSPILSFEGAFLLFARLSADYLPAVPLYGGYENPDASGFLLGEELVLSAVWTPLSDLSLNIGAAFFFPDNGPSSVYLPMAPIAWALRLGVLLSW